MNKELTKLFLQNYKYNKHFTKECKFYLYITYVIVKRTIFTINNCLKKQCVTLF